MRVADNVVTEKKEIRFLVKNLPKNYQLVLRVLRKKPSFRDNILIR